MEKIEVEKRAKRLRWAREKAGFAGPVAVAEALNMSVNSYKAHESGRNGFGTAHARAYARLFNVSLPWLYLGIGSPEDRSVPSNVQHLREILERLVEAPEDVQSKIISYAEFELNRLPKSLETTIRPTS